MCLDTLCWKSPTRQQGALTPPNTVLWRRHPIKEVRDCCSFFYSKLEAGCQWMQVKIPSLSLVGIPLCFVYNKDMRATGYSSFCHSTQVALRGRWLEFTNCLSQCLGDELAHYCEWTVLIIMLMYYCNNVSVKQWINELVKNVDYHCLHFYRNG